MSAGRIVIVGGGIVGAAIFHRLAGAFGARVLLLERSIPAVGATGFSGGILRAFHTDPGLAADCALGLAAYARLVRAHGADFAPTRTGFLQLIDATHLEAARCAYELLGADFDLRWLEPEAAARRFALSAAAGLSAAVLEPGAGYVDARRVTMRFLALGQAAGGQVRTGVELRGLAPGADAPLAATTNIGTLECDRIVVCAGAWTPTLLQRLRLQSPVRLRAKAIQVNVVSRPVGSPLPAFVDAATGAYGRPDGPATALVGCPVDAWDVDPDVMESPDEAVRDQAFAAARRRFGWLEPGAASGGMRRHDAYEPGGRGIVAPCVDRPEVIVASGFGGNGVKLAPLVADRVAGLLATTAALRTPELVA